jgi:hypothetical protein
VGSILSHANPNPMKSWALVTFKPNTIRNLLIYGLLLVCHFTEEINPWRPRGFQCDWQMHIRSHDLLLQLVVRWINGSTHLPRQLRHTAEGFAEHDTMAQHSTTLRSYDGQSSNVGDVEVTALQYASRRPLTQLPVIYVSVFFIFFLAKAKAEILNSRRKVFEENSARS